jgi:hypothetical protein
LYYYVARWYDPAIGRFIQADTIVPNPASARGFDRYSYGFNNPLMYLDPSGHGPTVYLDGVQLAYTDNSHTSHISSTPTGTWTPPQHSSNSRPGNSSRPKKNSGPSSGPAPVPAPGREEALPIQIIETVRQDAPIFGGDWFEFGGFSESSNSYGNGLVYFDVDNGILVEFPIPGGTVVTMGLQANGSTTASVNVDSPVIKDGGTEFGNGWYAQIDVPWGATSDLFSLSNPTVTAEYGTYNYSSVLAVEGSNNIVNTSSAGTYVRTRHLTEFLVGAAVPLAGKWAWTALGHYLTNQPLPQPAYIE